MGKNNDGVYSKFYAPHLAGGQPRYRASPSRNSKNALYSMYWRVLTELSLNRFKWYGLPDSVDERYLELSLMRHGGVLFFYYQNESVGDRYLVQQFMGVGRPNHYDNPTRFRVVSDSLIHGEYTPYNAVPIWGNYLRQPDFDIVEVYTQRLTELDTTIDVNTSNMRYPRVMVMPETAKLTYENIDRQKQAGVPVIKLNNTINPQDVYATLDMGSHHETIPGLLASRGKMWNDALMMLGVPTVNQDKKERMITQEAETGKDQSEVIRNIALNSRKQAAEQINTIFPDLNIAVEWRAHDEMQQLVSQYAQMLHQDNGSQGSELFDDNDEGV